MLKVLVESSIVLSVCSFVRKEGRKQWKEWRISDGLRQASYL